MKVIPFLDPSELYRPEHKKKEDFRNFTTDMVQLFTLTVRSYRVYYFIGLIRRARTFIRLVRVNWASIILSYLFRHLATKTWRDAPITVKHLKYQRWADICIIERLPNVNIVLIEMYNIGEFMESSFRFRGWRYYALTSSQSSVRINFRH